MLAIIQAAAQALDRPRNNAEAAIIIEIHTQLGRAEEAARLLESAEPLSDRWLHIRCSCGILPKLHDSLAGLC